MAIEADHPLNPQSSYLVRPAACSSLPGTCLPPPDPRACLNSQPVSPGRPTASTKHPREPRTLSDRCHPASQPATATFPASLVEGCTPRLFAPHPPSQIQNSRSDSYPTFPSACQPATNPPTPPPHYSISLCNHDDWVTCDTVNTLPEAPHDFQLCTITLYLYFSTRVHHRQQHRRSVRFEKPERKLHVRCRRKKEKRKVRTARSPEGVPRHQTTSNEDTRSEISLGARLERWLSKITGGQTHNTSPIQHTRRLKSLRSEQDLRLASRSASSRAAPSAEAPPSPATVNKLSSYTHSHRTSTHSHPPTHIHTRTRCHTYPTHT